MLKLQGAIKLDEDEAMNMTIYFFGGFKFGGRSYEVIFEGLTIIDFNHLESLCNLGRGIGDSWGDSRGIVSLYFYFRIKNISLPPFWT
ncbi:MAG: hypothetical protein Ct9H300mP21_03480 [Pseudomonadota bacterium]|nr:MAG: hypothetical protein Ct9H300mP21_03480 [Pseudomonadota bacterium]